VSTDPSRIEQVLVVCTANQCRSPLGAAVLAQRLAPRDLGVTVASAGTHALDGIPATEATVAAAALLGLDLSEHRSQRLTRSHLTAADLVITMERHHLREVVVLHPPTFAHAFTLRELARRVGRINRAPEAANTAAARLALLHEGRRPADLLGASAVDDVEDPTGQRFADHETMARDVSELVDRVVAALWPITG
jgi:protein-tyrosine phosphatase